MTQKRQITEQDSFSVKRIKTFESELEASTSILQWTRSSICWTCDIINHEEECLQKDIEPFEYYNLASILLNPSQVKLFKDTNDNENLLRSASHLNRDRLELVFNKLNKYIYNCSTKEIVQDLDNLLGDKLPHRNREIAFVVQLVELFKKNLDSTLVDLIKEGDPSNLIDILSQNVRCARLLPLISLAISDIEQTNADVSIIISDGGQDDVEEIELSSSLSLTQIIDMTDRASSQISANDDSHLILAVPSSQPRPESPMVDTTSNILPELLTQTSFSFDNPSTPTPEVEPVAEPISDAPNYDELSTDEIRAKIRSYGFKPASRSVMITYLEQLRAHLKSAPSTSKNKPKNSTLNKTSSQRDTRTEIEQYLRSNQDIWTKILMYEPLDLDELCKNMNIPCKKSELKTILDECCANVKKPYKRKNKK